MERTRTGTIALTAVAAIAALGIGGCSSDTRQTSSSSADSSGKVSIGDGSVWVANENGNSVSVIDAGSRRVVATLTGVPGPHNIQVSADGDSAWVVSGPTSRVAGINAHSYALDGSAPTGEHPAHVVELPAIGTPPTGWIATSNSADNTLSFMTKSLSPLGTVAVGKFPHGLRPSPDGLLIAVANMHDGTVSIVDRRARKELRQIAVGDTPVQVAWAPDGASLYATINGSDQVVRVDPKAGRVTGRAAVGDGPVQVYVSPDGRTLAVANQGTEKKPSNTLTLLDLPSMKVRATVKTGPGAHGVAIDNDSHFAWVTNTWDDSVSVVDIRRARVVARIPVGKAPNGISLSPHPARHAPSPKIALDLPSNSEDGDDHGEQDDHAEDEDHD